MVRCGVSGFDGMGDVLRPIGADQAAIAGGVTAAQQQQQPGKVLTGDLDSSLASLANNLTINKSAQQSVKYEHYFICYTKTLNTF